MKYFTLAIVFALFSVKCFAALPPIIGPSTVCTGSIATLANSVFGGTWSSSDVAVAIVGSSSGVVSGVAAGTATITYTDGVDFAYSTITVNSSPAPISGSFVICTGSSTTLTSSPGGGTWASSTIVVGDIGASTGTITGLSAGTTMVSYTLPTGCRSVTVVTVSPVPAPISGPASICIGGSALYTSFPSLAGTWSSSSPAIATVTAGGLVTGVATGTTYLTFSTAVGCNAIDTVTVNPSIGSISGASTVCVGAATTLTNSVAGGSWSSSNPSIAAVDASTGSVTGIVIGTANITYSLSGCINTRIMTVNTAPGSVTGAASLCAGATTTLSVSSGSGGVWSSGTPSVATVSATGVVYGATLGTASITYAVGACGSSSRVVTVTSSCAGTPVTGAVSVSSSLVCSGTPLVLSLPTYTPACGNVIQWEYSTTGLSWSNLPGANSVPYTHTPTAGYYYRCRITCASGGSTAYSGPVYVGVNFGIGSHSIISAPDVSCSPTHFYVTGCGVSSTFSVITQFGDGTADTTALTTSTLSEAHIYHTYSLPGTYTVRHIMLNAGIPIDTATFSYNYLFCRTLPISFYKDNNSNCVFDAGDIANLVAVTTQIDSNGVPVDTIVATSGFYYKALGAPGTIYAFRPISVDGGMVLSCPVTSVIYDTINIYTNTYVTKYFGVNCGSSSDFDLGIVASSLANGTRQQFSIVVRNTHCTPVSPVVSLTFSPKYEYLPLSIPSSWTYPTPTTVVGNTLTWNLSALSPDSVKSIVVNLQRSAILGLPLLPGDTVNTVISVAPMVGDLDTTNNTIVRIDTVRTSYDPNDMAVMPGGYILPCTELEYTVRFENLGNDTAHNVYVLDTLSPALNPASLKVITASAAMNVSVINDGVRNIAKFDFPGIKLADSSNHAANNGMFVFKIKALSTLADGTDIPNRAGIFFDDNPVVMTNSVSNTIGMAPITGPGHICLGFPDTLFNTMQGGTWASSTPAVGSIAPIGIVTGIIAGTTTISYTVSNSCVSRTATKEVTVNPVVSTDVSITLLSDTACSGTPVVYTAIPVNGGLTPAYNWRINGFLVGGGDSYTYTPIHRDTVSVTLITSEACGMPATVSDTVVMTVFPTGTPVATLSVSPNDTSCAGLPVTFTATPIYGGSLPGYTWFVNGTLSGSGTTFSYLPLNADVIYCRMGSDYLCRLSDTVTSANIIMTVDPLYIPVINISATPGLTIPFGEPVTFTATVIGGGPSPVYQWFLNGTSIAGATNNIYVTSTLADYDSVTCRVTGSGVCSITSFNSVYMTVWPAGVTTMQDAVNVHILPNPNSGAFTLKGFVDNSSEDGSVNVSNLLGQTVYSRTLKLNNGRVNEDIQLPQNLAEGVYLLDFRSGNQKAVFRIQIAR